MGFRWHHQFDAPTAPLTLKPWDSWLYESTYHNQLPDCARGGSRQQAFCSITEARSGAPHRTVSTINLGFRLPWCMKILPSSAFPTRTPYLCAIAHATRTVFKVRRLFGSGFFKWLNTLPTKIMIAYVSRFYSLRWKKFA